MNVLVIGSGGREHALAWKIRQSPLLGRLYAAPGNPGITSVAECIAVKADDLPGLLDVARSNNIDLTVVGPEQPLAEGIVDLFEGNGLTIFGPSQAAARLEWSKAYAKEFMQRYNIPTAAHRTFEADEENELIAHLKSFDGPVVLKADGLAAGKGVMVCRSQEEALQAANEILSGKVFGKAGEKIVVEEFMEGTEASVFAVCDGTNYVLLAPAQDHKRALDNDLGKNTGGMGAYAPAPVVTQALMKRVISDILEPTLSGMRSEGIPYRGCLYIGLMLTDTGPKVVEYNCRFGDPETQVVLPLYGGDLLALLNDAAIGKLAVDGRTGEVNKAHGSAVCVVLASGGYPDDYATGKEIAGLDVVEAMQDVLVFHAGTRMESGKTITSGGRVLGVTAVQKDGRLDRAISRAYAAVRSISFDGMRYRTDIGRKGLAVGRHFRSGRFHDL